MTYKRKKILFTVIMAVLLMAGILPRYIGDSQDYSSNAVSIIYLLGALVVFVFWHFYFQYRGLSAQDLARRKALYAEWRHKYPILFFAWRFTTIAYFTVTFAILAGLIFISFISARDQAIMDEQSQERFIDPVPLPALIENDEVILMFVGDIMLTRSVGEKIEQVGDWRWPFLKIGEYLRSADLTFGNLETTISERGHNVGSIYSFRSDPRVVEGLKFAGFDLLSVANNHMGDWTRTALEDTLNILKENSIDYVGGGFSEEEAHSPVVREVKGTKFCFLGYTDLGARYTEAKEDVSGIAWSTDKDIVIRDVREADKSCDFLTVSFHFGEEYKPLSNARQKLLARGAVDAGANFIIGHHPHVIQETEEYNGGFIAYSLGNFIFDQNFSKETMEGLILKVTVIKSELIDIESIKVGISRDYQASVH